ncbi:endonuclease/exonuclease/phosphatase family protein [Ruminococcus sp.]|uniref:endonuclease/exonuclease/phosphatase family protein n=1 Tax=Ruminococcus sp. TaxID=41978 RepID=UPI0025D46BB5|nr:endonuclease/exonuclease/phosphatase family protein [Ruminococcus sp.]
MKISTWNVQGKAALPWANETDISNETVNRIMNEKADIFVITEIALASGWDYLEKKMLEEEYVWFSSFVSGNNGFLILVKKELIKNVKELANNLWWKNEALHCYNDIGLMKVSFKMSNDKNCTVCAFRMLIGNKKGKAQYDDMRRILYKKVLPIAEECYLENDVVIFAGDFNNARYLDDYNGKDQINYNWQILKSKFENIGYEMLDVNDKGKPINTKQTAPPSPIDHIFAKGFIKNTCMVSEPTNCSDHLILRVTGEWKNS